MSNTFKTNLARTAHKARIEGYYNAQQSGQSEVIPKSESDKISRLMLDMKMSGSRHGNNRHDLSNVKIKKRRIERFAKRDELRRELKIS